MEWYWWLLLAIVLFGILGAAIAALGHAYGDRKVGHFRIRNDGTLIDERTGLMWLKDGDCAVTAGVPLNRNYNNGVNWFQAQDLIWKLNQGAFKGRLGSQSFNDWRMPTIQEMEVFLQGITYNTERIFPNLFATGKATGGKYWKNYWTSTEPQSWARTKGYVCTAKRDQKTATQPKETAYHHVWPVRTPSS